MAEERKFHTRTVYAQAHGDNYWATVFVQCPHCSTEYDARSLNDEMRAENLAKAACRAHIGKMHFDKE